MIKVNGEEIKVAHFPDNTQLLHLAIEDEVNRDIAKIEWQYENDSELATLMFINSHLRQQLRVGLVVLYMGYIPNARFDRVKHTSEIFTLKYFAQFINSMKFDHVIVLDPHSYVSEALFDNLIILSPENSIRTAISYTEKIYNSDNLLVFYPDEGSVKRLSGLVNRPYCFGIKTRDWDTGEIKGLKLEGEISRIKGADVIILDDIVSRGGSAYHSAKALKDAGADRIFFYVSHCESTIFEGKLIESDLITHIYTTNSLIFPSHEKITVYNWMMNEPNN